MKYTVNVLAFLCSVILCLPAYGANPAVPGTVNYVEGAVSLSGRQLNDQDVGQTELNAGQVLATQHGRAEMLLTPGIYMRLDDYSAVRMVSPELTNTEVDLVRGHASVEVDEIYRENDVQVGDSGAVVQLLKPGYYEFNTADPTARIAPAVDVFSGEAAVALGDGRYKTLKSHREFVLPARPHEKAAKFDPADVRSGLYDWSSLRSEYLAEANNQIAGEYYGAEGFYPGWYWDPYAWDYTYIGLDPFWSPFGWGFYPPWYGFYGGGFYGGGYYGGFRGGYGGGHPVSPVHPLSGGGFHGGGGFGGGGFHGGGGRR